MSHAGVAGFVRCHCGLWSNESQRLTRFMPLANLFTLALTFVVGALIYRFRERILAPMRRFEARNAQRRADEARALFDSYAHYRQTVQLAEEQVEPVAKITVPDERTGQPMARFLFLGVQYASLGEAEAVRYAEIIAKARDFYIDLDRTWLPRHWGREPLAGALPDLTRREKVRPPRP